MLVNPKDSSGDAHLGNQVLIAFYESFHDNMPLYESSKPEMSWTNNQIKYDRGVIIRGRSYMIGKVITFAYDTVKRRGTQPYCEITPKPEQAPCNQFIVKRLRTWRDIPRQIMVTDIEIIKQLCDKDEWVYGEAEIIPMPIIMRQQR